MQLSIIITLVGFLSASASAAALAKRSTYAFTLYSGYDLSGTAWAHTGDTSLFDLYTFSGAENDAASSLKVTAGKCKFCKGTGLTDNCVCASPSVDNGVINDLSVWVNGDNISSAQCYVDDGMWPTGQC